jgi:threonine aldolase
MILFSCDYQEGCHPSILQKLTETNMEQTVGYGMDDYCQQAADMIRKRFKCENAAVHFLVGGTQANATVIDSILRSYEGVLCADTGHINVHETGAIEATGHKVLALPGKDGRITSAQISVATALQADDEHTVRPGMVYISLSTEIGTLYNLAQLHDIYETCKKLGLYLYVDGARLGCALMSPVNDIQVEDLAANCDAFTIGGTKNGALFGEAVVLVNPALQPRFRYMIKQHGGMLAKGRLLGLQFMALMENDLYFTIASHAVDEAMRIRTALREKQIPLVVDSPTNQLFPIFTDEQLEKLEENFVFSTWERIDEKSTAVRICTSWATKTEDVDQLIAAIKAL